MPNPVNVEVEIDITNNVTILKIPKRVSLTRAANNIFDEALPLASLRNGQKIVISIDTDTFMDFTGIGQMISFIFRAEKAGSTITIACQDKKVLENFARANMATIVGIFHDMDSAMASLET